MEKVDNLILYELDLNEYKNLYYSKYIKRTINCEDYNSILKEYIKNDDLKGGVCPPDLIKHCHIDETQRIFSLLIESGNNIYAIRLSENLNCQFGYGTSPITLFSPGFSGEFIKSCELRNNENDSVIDFRRESKLSLDGFNWLIFAIDRASVIKTLEAAAKLAKQQGSHSHKHDSDRDRSEEVTDRFAIPFYFNLYQKPVGIPIWVLNDHEHSPMATKTEKFHGGAHPNSNGFLMLE